jgi:hypothetical protein
MLDEHGLRSRETILERRKEVRPLCQRAVNLWAWLNCELMEAGVIDEFIGGHFDLGQETTG